jgi:nucleoside-diphosphate-sugar epimerase
MQKPILVTGGSGFIGMYVCQALAARGERVINYDLRPLSPEGRWLLGSDASRIEFHEGRVDVLSEVIEAVHRHQPDSVIHIGAIVWDMPNQPYLALKVNTEGTINVLEAARIFGLRRVVNFSTIGVLTTRQYNPIDASHPMMLATDGPGVAFYSSSKVAAEAFCWGYLQSFGVDFITIRPSAVYGFGQLVPNFIKPMIENAVQGVPSRFSSGAGVPRDYTHAIDLAQLTLKSLDIPADKVKDRVFYGATGRPPITAAQLAVVVRSLFPQADILVDEVMEPIDRFESRFRGTLSIDNAVEQLGYQPEFQNLETGILQYARTFQDYLAKSRS